MRAIVGGDGALDLDFAIGDLVDLHFERLFCFFDRSESDETESASFFRLNNNTQK